MGLRTGPHARTPPHPQPVGSGPRQPAQRAGSRGWESARSRTPHTQARGAPPGTLKPPPQHARARAVGLVTGSHARSPPHPQPVGSAPRQPAQRAGSRGWESARPQTLHTQAGGARPRHPQAAPATPKASSQERALWGWGRVPTPARPRIHSQWVVRPGSPPRGRALGGGRAPHPGRLTPRQEAPPPGTLKLPPQHAKARAVGLVTGSHARTPPHPPPVGSGPRQPAQRAGSRGWESALPRTPHTQARGIPPGHPHAAPTARKASSQDRALWGWGRVPTPAPPETHSQWVVGPGSPPRGRAVGGGRAPDPGSPTPRQEAPPPGALVPPPQHAKPARKSARCGVGDGSPGPHPPAP